MTNEELGEINFQMAKSILKLLDIKPNDPGALRGLQEACADCERYGPVSGPCMSLRLARETGVEYTPPEWCKDPETRCSRCIHKVEAPVGCGIVEYVYATFDKGCTQFTRRDVNESSGYRTDHGSSGSM